MKVTERWHSERMGRDISLVRWGHYGVPVLLFPTAGGDAEEVERHRLVGTLTPMIEAGRIKLYSCDSAAGQALQRNEGSPEHRMWLFNQYHQAVAEEVVPAIHADSSPQSVVVAGASIGAFNSFAMICRYPHLFGAAVCMSGTYHVEQFIGGDTTEDWYFSSPLQFLPGLEGPALDMLRQSLRRAGLRQRPRGRTSASRGPPRMRWAARESPTGSTTGATATTTTGPRGGRCCRSTSTTWCRDRAVRSPTRLAAAVDAGMPRLATTSRVSSRCVRWPTRRSSPRASAGRRPRWWVSCSPRPVWTAYRRIRHRTGRSRWSGARPARTGAPRVLLYSHYDVVPVGDPADWQTPPWELTERDGRWYGRGSADCKGNLVASLLALRALREVLGEWPVEVAVVCEGSEEQSSGGMEALARAPPRPRGSATPSCWLTPATSRPDCRP